MKKWLLLSVLFAGGLAADIDVQNQSFFEDSQNVPQINQVEAPQLYASGKTSQTGQALEDAFANAKKSILAFTFTFSDPNIIQLLNKKAEEGVDVVVVVDAGHRDYLVKEGSNKLLEKLLTRSEGEGRVHHKIYVIDDEDIWIGGANLSSGAFNLQDNLMTRVKSKKLAQAIRDESEVFRSRKKRTGEVPSEMIGDQEVALYLLPHVEPGTPGPEKIMNANAKRELLALIRNAKNHIRIAMMLWTDRELRDAVLEAHKRGVPVEVITQYMDIGTIPLRAAGISVKVQEQHGKWMWVDDTLVNGSANWTLSSFSRSDESFIVLKNLNENQKSLLESYWQDLLRGQIRGPESRYAQR